MKTIQPIKILTGECKHCGKTITSIYPEQLKFNLKMHEQTCKKKGEKQ